ncbi:hypothetical protein BGX31_004241, partial [Mortierella sp. GBA43]
GELISRATKLQSSLLLNTDIRQDGAKASGKKLDLQCRAGSDDLEIDNSEFKRCSTSPSKLDPQYPKNLLINHAMLLYLKDNIGLDVNTHHILFLDVH